MKSMEVIDVIIRSGVMSLDELKSETGITPGILLEWLQGEPNTEQKQAICRALGAPNLFNILETIPVPSDLPPRQWDC